MASITAISPERKQSARLLALAYVLSWASVFGLLIWLSAAPEAIRDIKAASVWLFLLVVLVIGAMIVLAIGGTIARLDTDHQGNKALAGWVGAGLIGGLFSGLTNLPFIINNEAGWASLLRNILWFGGPLVGYALAFRRNPITTFASLPPAAAPTGSARWIGGSLLVLGIIGLIIASWIVNGILTEPGFRAPWGMAATLPASLALIAFGWPIASYPKPYDREALLITCLGVLLSLVSAGIAITWFFVR